MKARVVIITEIIAPYRVPVFNALAAREDFDLRVVFLSETDRSLRQWNVPTDEIRFSYEVLPSFRQRLGKYNFLLNWRVRSTLERLAPDAIVCGGYSYLASWQALRWARARNIPLLLWIESTAADQRRGNAIVESAKRKFVSMCQGFVVPGRASAEYLQRFGVGPDSIFRAPNAVDNDFFSAAAERARSDAPATRRKLGLPDRYFLNVGRLVRAKGVFELLEAYAKLKVATRESVGLVYVGDGAAREELVRRAAQVRPGCIRFAGFVQKDQLGEYYALADAMVFPTHSDTWGFVVNEAMACGAPVVASDVAGCVADLLREGVGKVVPPHEITALCGAMEALAGDEGLRLQMRERGRKWIEQYSPVAWAAGVAEAASWAMRRQP